MRRSVSLNQARATSSFSREAHMKKRFTLLTALVVIVLGCSTPRPASSQEKKPESQVTSSDESSAKAAEAMKGLRNRLLTSSAEEVGLSGKDAEAKVWGVLMEVAFPSGVSTIVSIRDGTASLYTSTGGGVLGGYSAREEAKRFVAEAEKHFEKVIRLEPNNVQAHFALASVYRRLGRQEDATREMKQYEELKGADSQ